MQANHYSIDAVYEYSFIPLFKKHIKVHLNTNIKIINKTIIQFVRINYEEDMLICYVSIFFFIVIKQPGVLT